MADRYDTLNPNHIIASVASLPRRWTEGFRVPDDVSFGDLFVSVSSDGTCIAEHLGATIAQLDILADALTIACYVTPEPLDTQVSAAMANTGSGSWPASPKEGLEKVLAQFVELQSAIEGVRTSDWNKSVLLGSSTVKVIDITRAVSRVGAERLRAVESLISELS